MQYFVVVWLRLTPRGVVSAAISVNPTRSASKTVTFSQSSVSTGKPLASEFATDLTESESNQQNLR